MNKLALMVFFEWRALNRISFAFYSWSYKKHLNQLLEPLSQSQYLWDVGYRRLAVKAGQILNWRWFCKTIFPLASIRFHITPIRDICCPNHQCKVTNRIPCSRRNKLIWSLNMVKKYIYHFNLWPVMGQWRRHPKVTTNHNIQSCEGRVNESRMHQ